MKTTSLACLLLPLTLAMSTPASAQSVTQLKEENAALKARIKTLEAQLTQRRQNTRDANTGLPTTAEHDKASTGPGGPPPKWNPKGKRWTFLFQTEEYRYYIDPSSVRSEIIGGVRYVRGDFHHKPNIASAKERFTIQSISYDNCIKASKDGFGVMYMYYSDDVEVPSRVTLDASLAASKSAGSGMARRLCELRSN